MAYDERSKERTMRYLKEKRDKLTLNLPLGDKERYKDHAKSVGKSLTVLIVELLEEHIKATEEHRKELELLGISENTWNEIKKEAQEIDEKYMLQYRKQATGIFAKIQSIMDEETKESE